MKAPDYSGQSTERLIELFAEAAGRVGIGRGRWEMFAHLRRGDAPAPALAEPPPDISNGPRPEGSEEPPRRRRTHPVLPAEPPPEMVEAVKAGVGAALALTARNATAEIQSLFRDDDPDVRANAATLFASIDREAASAAMHSLQAQCSTEEMLALRRLARETPPRRPTLQEMSDDALVARFENAATRENATQFLDTVTEKKDLATSNRVGRELVDIIAELKARGLLARLVPLLSSANLTVRWRSAQACLRLAEDQAVAALESVSAKGGFKDGWAARDTLEAWRKGTCLVDGI